MAGKRKLGYFDGEQRREATPVCREHPIIPQPSPNMVYAFLQKMSEQQETFMENVIRRLDSMEADISELKGTKEEPAPKRIKRVGNNSVSEAVRRMHNAEINTLRYDPQTSVSSPHNQWVTTNILNNMSEAFPDVDPRVVKASCKTYYRSTQRSYRMNQEDNRTKKEQGRVADPMRQRKIILHNARASFLHTEKEVATWKTATLDMMSEEEDATLDGRPVWVIRPPARSTELSSLCAVLQNRLEANQKWFVNPNQRISAYRFLKETRKAC